MRMGRQTNCSGMPVYDNNVCTLKMEAQVHGGDPEFYNDTFTCKAFQETISPGWFIDIQWCMNGVDFVSINFSTYIVMLIGCGLCFVCLIFTYCIEATICQELLDNISVEVLCYSGIGLQYMFNSR